MKSPLRLLEIFSSFAFILLFASLLVIAKRQSHLLRGAPLAPLKVAVTIEGHVSKPGVQWVELGTPLTAVVARAKPKRRADLSQVEGRVQKELHLEILPLKKEISPSQKRGKSTRACKK